MSIGDAVFAWVRASVAEGARGVAAAATSLASSACGRQVHALAVASALPPCPVEEVRGEAPCSMREQAVTAPRRLGRERPCGCDTARNRQRLEGRTDSPSNRK